MKKSESLSMNLDLNLRTVIKSDLEPLFEIENDQSSWRNSENYDLISKELLEGFIDSIHDLDKHGQLRLMIVSEKTVLGCVDFFGYEKHHKRAGVGIYVLEEFRGAGVASRAINRGVNWIKKTYGVELIYCTVLESNSASLALFKSLGFEQTGMRKGWQKIEGNRENAILFQRFI